MTCAHVSGLIDAGPFADITREHLDAARAHARACPTCGPALRAAGMLAADLRALPQPESPPHLEAVVLARIARAERVAGASAAQSKRAVSRWAVGATVAGSLAAGIGVHGMTMGQAAPPVAVLSMLALGAGLGLYLVGLFAPLDRRS